MNFKKKLNKILFILSFFVFLLGVLFLTVLSVMAKEKIRVYSLFFNPEITDIINKHIENYKNLKTLSLFDLEYYNVESFKDFNSVLLNSNPDIVIAPLDMYYIIKNKYNLIYFDNYLNSNPTIFSVFKSYTVDFMKNSVYDLRKQDNQIYALPLFSYSLYYISNSKGLVLPKVTNLSLPEVISYYRALSNNTDYIKFWKTYLNSVNELKDNKVSSELYTLIGNVNPQIKTFPIKDNTLIIDNPVVSYGIFITTNTNNKEKIKSCYYLSSKLWDFEVQIDLALNLGLLASDKQTTLHPGYIAKLKDPSFSAKYNNALLKYSYVLTDLDFELYYSLFEQVIQNKPEEFIKILNDLLYPNVDKVIQSYLNLVKINKFKNYLVLVKFNETTKFLYSDLDYFIKERLRFTKQVDKTNSNQKNQNNQNSLNFVDISIYEVFNNLNDVKREQKMKNELLNKLNDYKVNRLENDKDNFVISLEPKVKNKSRKIILKRYFKDNFSNELMILFIGD